MERSGMRNDLAMWFEPQISLRSIRATLTTLRFLLAKKIDAGVIADAEFDRSFANCCANSRGDCSLDLIKLD
jgi:hypothetical protein